MNAFPPLFIAFPEEFARGEFDAAEAGVWFVSAAECVEVFFVKDWR